MTGARAYGGVTADVRREQRRVRLVDAVLDGLLADGLGGVSVRSVCARARLTPRYFYESFADLEALLVAAVDTVTDEVAEQSMAALRAVPPGDTTAQVRAAISSGYGVLARDPRKANVLLVASAGHGVLRERRDRLVTRYADLVLEGLTVLRTQAPQRRRTARATALFLMGGSADLIEAVLAGRLRMSRRALVDQLTGLWVGALASAFPDNGTLSS